MDLNNLGFAIIHGSDVVAWSERSAWSGVLLGGGAVTCAVNDVPGLLYRLAPTEARQFTPEQFHIVEERARDWYATPTSPEPVTADPEPPARASRRVSPKMESDLPEEAEGVQKE